MVDYGSFEISLDEEVNDALVSFSYDMGDKYSAEELFCILIGYGLDALGYLEN